MVSADRTLYGLVSAGYVMGYISAYSMPVFVGALMAGFGISEKEIGFIVSAELGGIAISSILLAGNIGRLNLRYVALLGCMIALLGHGITLAAGSLWFFVLARFFAGIGEGMVLAAGNGGGASASNPDRVFAVAQIAISIFTMLLVGLLPHVIGTWGYRGGILGIIVVIFLWFPVIFSFPASSAVESNDDSVKHGFRFPNLRFGVFTLGAFALMTVADVAIWVFSEQIGVRIGISPNTIGLLLGITTGLGLLGALLAAVISDRFGRLIPMTIALLLLAASNIGLGQAETFSGYAFSLLPLNLAILFLTPYFLGTLSGLDTHGSWTAATGVIGPLAFASGPLLAGMIIVDGDYSAVGWMTGGFSVAALFIMAYVLTAYKEKTQP